MNRSRSGRRRKTPPSKKLFHFAVFLLVILMAAALWLFYKSHLRPLLNRSKTPAAEPSAAVTTRSAPVSTAAPQTETPSPETTTADESEPVTSTVTMLCVGDNLIHNTVYQSGYGSNPWNYDHLYQHVRDDIEAADLAVINQETIFVQNHDNVSSYPVFGTPREIGDAVYKAGFDVILHATNHVMDMGIQNVYDAVDYWSDKDVTVLGIHKDAADAAKPKIVEKNGIKIGMINYTYGLNGFQLPAGNEFAVDLLENEDKLLADVAYLEENADITVAFIHVGIEYMIRPSDETRYYVERLVSHGVDVFVGGHPHVVEPYEWYTASNGNEALVYYSLGNFISAQNQLDRLIGGMATFTIEKTTQNGTSVTKVTDYDLKPLVTHTTNKTTAYAVYHMEDYTDYLGSQNFFVKMTTDQLWKRWHEIIGD
ncbi:MAG: CapA family protein [Oscillospiraceae bacterium]|nr:CapA family protein [Oscillospiraceae bacterium]